MSDAVTEIDERLYRTLFESASDAIILSRPPDGIIVSTNPAAQTLLGYSAHEISECVGVDLIAPEVLGTTIDAWTTQVEERGEFLVETLWVHKDGTRIPVSVSGKPVTVDGQLHFFLVGRDIRDRKRAEAERAELEEQLRQRDRLETIGTLAGGVAHDFNNVLQVMRALVELSLWKLEPESEVHDNLTQISGAVDRAAQIVDQILAFSRGSTDAREAVRVHEIVNEAAAFLRASMPSTIDLTLSLDAEDDTILGSAAQIHQVVMNLCTNAVQAMATDGGELRVRVESFGEDHVHPDGPAVWADTPHLLLTVSDSGPGVDPAVAARIWEPFFTTKNVGEGTGLGLSVVHGIVRSHGGEIRVDGSPGGGAAFRVYFPLSNERASPPDEPIGVIPEGTEHVLLVEDDKVIGKLTERVLRHAGYAVTLESDGGAAIEIFAKHAARFDIVVTDQTMPIVVGIKCAESILGMRPDIPIILLTGYADPDLTERAKMIGITEVLAKPVMPTRLLRSVARLLEDARRATAG